MAAKGSDFLQNFWVVRSCCADHFYLVRFLILLMILSYYQKRAILPYVLFLIWPPRAILISDYLMLKKSSPLKLLDQMEPNLAGSIYVRSSIKLLHFVPFGQQTWLLDLDMLHIFAI
jgi:hypothetical protein